MGYKFVSPVVEQLEPGSNGCWLDPLNEGMIVRVDSVM